MEQMSSTRRILATCAVLSLASIPAAGQGPTRPPGARWAIHKITPASPEQIAAFRGQAMDWYHKAQKSFAPSLRLVETRNFLLVTTWPRKVDRRLRQVCETMYTHLRREFVLPRSQVVWAGKLPIFIFEKTDHFKRFSNEVDRRKSPNAGGYLAQRSDGFCYMVLNRVYSRTHFYGLLVHEGTHAFLARYRTDAPIVTWVNEGLAETMAAQLVPGCEAAERYVQATAEAVRRGKNVSGIFRDVRLKASDYGIAQSLVRFLIARDRKRFVHFIKLMKVGASDAAALKYAYGLSREELLAKWLEASKKALRRRR